MRKKCILAEIVCGYPLTVGVEIVLQMIEQPNSDFNVHSRVSLSSALERVIIISFDTPQFRLFQCRFNGSNWI